jgi:hypothetical protein
MPIILQRKNGKNGMLPFYRKNMTPPFHMNQRFLLFFGLSRLFEGNLKLLDDEQVILSPPTKLHTPPEILFNVYIRNACLNERR